MMKIDDAMSQKILWYQVVVSSMLVQKDFSSFKKNHFVTKQCVSYLIAAMSIKNYAILHAFRVGCDLGTVFRHVYSLSDDLFVHLKRILRARRNISFSLQQNLRL